MIKTRINLLWAAALTASILVATGGGQPTFAAAEVGTDEEVVAQWPTAENAANGVANYAPDEAADEMATPRAGTNSMAAGRYRFFECSKIYMDLDATTDAVLRAVRYQECSTCCRDFGYLYFKWERAGHRHTGEPATRKHCSCTQDIRQLTQMKDYLGEGSKAIPRRLSAPALPVLEDED